MEDNIKSYDKHFKNLTKGIEDHNFRHYNSAMGKFIYSKSHYIHEMKKGGYVPIDMAEDLSEQWEKENANKPYELSEQGRNLIKYFKGCCSNGMMKLGEHPKAVEEMEKLGMCFDMDKIEEMTSE